MTTPLVSAADLIRLTVLAEETGQPLPGVALEIIQPENSKTQLKTDQAGQCDIPLVSARPAYVLVHASHEGCVPKLIDWRTDNPEFTLPREFTLKLEKARSIGGVVADEQGRPIAGVEGLIILRASSCGLPQEIHNDIWEQKVKTDADGHWIFPGAPAALDYFSIRLVHPDFVGDDTADRPDPKALVAQTAKFVMKRGCIIEGTVREGGVTPLQGVSVLVNEHGNDSTTQPSFTTDAQGRYRIANAPRSTPGIMREGVLVTFFKKGFAPELAVVRTGSNPVTLDIEMQPGHRLAGRVVDEAGHSLEGVWVAPDHWRGFRPFGCVRLTTDSHGDFVWPDAPADEVVCDLLKDGYLPLRNTPLVAGRDVTLTMRRPIHVTGTVVDADTGAPILSFRITPGVQWTARSDGRKYVSAISALSGKDGRFDWSFDEPAYSHSQDGKTTEEGGHFLRIESPGYAPVDSRAIKDSEPGGPLEFRLSKAQDAVFHVLSRDGQPAAGAVVAVSGEGNAVQISDGKIRINRDQTSAVAADDGKVTLPPRVGNPTLVIAHPQFGYATCSLEAARKGESVTLTGWGRVMVHSPAVELDKKSPFYLNYESLTARSASNEVPDYYIDSRGEIQEDGTLLFTGVKPGLVRIGRYGQGDERAEEVQVPEGGEATVTMPLHDGIASIGGRVALPSDLANLKWSDQRGSMQSISDPAPWPKGLTIEERRKWLDETPEGRKLSKAHRFYAPRLADDGAFEIPDVAPGHYSLEIWLMSGYRTDSDRSLLGVYRQIITVPSREDLARLQPEHANEDFGSTFLQLQVDPPFFRSLSRGDRLPAFSADGLAGGKIDNHSLQNKKAIIVFYNYIHQELFDEANRLAPDARARGIEVFGLNTDDEKQSAVRAQAERPLSFPTAWIAPEHDPELMKKFGPLWSPTFLAINPDGTVRGRFTKAAEALGCFD